MAERIFPQGVGLAQRETSVRDCACADGLSETARLNCGCASMCCCPSLIAGPAGPAGPAGETPTFTIGTVSTGPEAEVTITGTAPDYVLNFVIPVDQPAE